MFKCFLICTFLMVTTISYAQQPVITKRLLIEKLTNNQTKAWFKCGSLARSDRKPGDKKYIFSKSDGLLTIQHCNDQRKWVNVTTYKWTIVPKGDNTPTGWNGFLLKVNNEYAVFSFDAGFNTLTLKLPSWNEGLCLN